MSRPSTPPPAPPGDPSYRRRVLSSLAWQGSAQLLGQLAAWSATLVVIRLLDPADYGIMAMATVFLSLLLTLSDLGIGAAIIQASELSREEARSIQNFVFLFTGVGFAVTVLGSEFVAAFFEEPRLVPILRVLSGSFVLMAFHAVPTAVLMRELRFDLKAKVDFAALLVSALTSLFCALLGFGVWSLVAGALADHAAKAIGFNSVRPGLVVPRFSFAEGFHLLRFGSLIAVNRLLWFVYSNIDVLIAGKLLGKELLGLYSVTLALAVIPLDKVAPVLTSVSLSAFSRIQDDRERVRDNVLRSMRYGAILFLPIFWGMALVAPDGVPLVLGAKWQGTVVPFQLICAVLPLKALAVLLPPALFGVGRPLVSVVNMVLSLVVMSGAFYIGAHYGVIGLAMAWVVAYPLVFAVTTVRSLRALQVPLGGFFRNVRGAAVAGLGMAAGVYAVQTALPAGLPALPVLLISVPVGGVVYLGAVWLLERDVIGEIRLLLAR